MILVNLLLNHGNRIIVFSWILGLVKVRRGSKPPDSCIPVLRVDETCTFALLHGSQSVKCTCSAGAD